MFVALSTAVGTLLSPIFSCMPPDRFPFFLFIRHAFDCSSPPVRVANVEVDVWASKLVELPFGTGSFFRERDARGAYKDALGFGRRAKAAHL